MKLSAVVCAIALWFFVAGCSGPVAADTFTFAPTDSTIEFQSTVVMERARYSDDVAGAVDSTKVTSYIRIDTAEGGYELTTQPLTILSTRDGERLRNPVLNIMMDVEIVMHIDRTSRATTVTGHEEIQERTIEYLPEYADQLRKTMNPRTMSDRDRSEWNARVQPILGREAKPGGAQYGRLDYALADGTHINYVSEVKVVDTFRVDGRLRARVSYTLDTDIDRLAERVNRPASEIRQALGSDSTGVEGSANAPASRASFDIVMEVSTMSVIESTSFREFATTTVDGEGVTHTGKVVESAVTTFSYDIEQ